uniref:ATP synthase F0 subunit 8 n=1 Tax=Alectorobius mimon TaxID=360319 RepID=UPI002238F5AD|nr:ATP synthase F0 subunit 8 [Alectorobius mimon]UYB78447.1 ATP synthase F0 subunit 8 [Alectorobius mimon]UYB78460.1 ATP synthase F0 subunit 8 [Alectorobius mimon]
MPQLFPMNWNLLIIFFLFIIIMSTNLIYFTYKPSLHFKYLMMKQLKKPWKW